MPHRVVRVRAERASPGYVLIMETPAGPVQIGRCLLTKEVGPTAYEGIARSLGIGPKEFDLDLHTERPAQFPDGCRVLIRETDDDDGHPDETVGRVGVVVGFIQGGVAVDVPPSGVGIYAPEQLDLQDGQCEVGKTRRS